MAGIDFGAAMRQQDGGAGTPFEGEDIQGAIEVAERGLGIAPANPYDLAPVRAQLQPFEDRLAAVAADASALEVKDEASNQTAAETLAVAKRLTKDLDAARKAIIGDADGYVRAVNNLAKALKDKLDGIARILTPKMSRYATLQEQARRAEEARRQKEAADLQKRLDAEAKKAGTEPVKVEAAPTPVPQGPVRTAAGTVQTRKVWKFEVEDAAQVPREFLIVDEARIRQAVRDGVREIKGVRIFEDTQIVTRT
jgi:hypothetical protein